MSDQYVGEIRLFAGNYAPQGWMICDGRVLQISDYSTLYALIGVTYGGNGSTTFALPDLRGRVAVHQGAGPNLTSRPIGSQYGTESVALSSSECPNHTHSFLVSAQNANSTNPENQVTGQTTIMTYGAPTDPSQVVKFSNQLVQPAGSSQGHSNMMPYICLTYIIATEGYFPSQS